MELNALDQAGVVICLTILLVLLINAMILMLVRRNRPNSEIEMMRRIASTARNPFAKEERQVEELSRLVAGLKEAHQGEKTDNPEDDQS